MIKRDLFSILIFLICSCNVNGDYEQKTNDSVNVLLTALKGKSFLKGNITYSDSLYFIKSKFYNKNFPAKSEYFALFYIEDKPNNKHLNFPGKNSDKRERYEIIEFKLSLDTGHIILYNLGVREKYEFYLKKTDNSWSIIKEHWSIN
ncbi:hypothetical protein [Pedobacter sp. ASV28]|uniref:hypothetical protein n=1 Tax=Pedobacter sp. ASV28 TaxID=2795123 RepID=UPI0018EBDEB9|nr:hypothetical protein [Pedobacter sp. ASV28]